MSQAITPENQRTMTMTTTTVTMTTRGPPDDDDNDGNNDELRVASGTVWRAGAACGFAAEKGGECGKRCGFAGDGRCAGYSSFGGFDGGEGVNFQWRHGLRGGPARCMHQKSYR